MAFSRKIFEDQLKEGHRKQAMLDLAEVAQNLETMPVWLNAIAYDNTLNAANTFLKLYDKSSPTVGTDEPEVIIPLEASKEGVVTFTGSGRPKFTIALAAAAVTTGGTAGTTGPTSDLDLDIMVEDVV